APSAARTRSATSRCPSTTSGSGRSTRASTRATSCATATAKRRAGPCQRDGTYAASRWTTCNWPRHASPNSRTTAGRAGNSPPPRATRRSSRRPWNAPTSPSRHRRWPYIPERWSACEGGCASPNRSGRPPTASSPTPAPAAQAAVEQRAADGGHDAADEGDGEDVGWVVGQGDERGAEGDADEEEADQADPGVGPAVQVRAAVHQFRGRLAGQTPFGEG